MNECRHEAVSIRNTKPLTAGQGRRQEFRGGGAVAGAIAGARGAGSAAAALLVHLPEHLGRVVQPHLQ